MAGYNPYETPEQWRARMSGQQAQPASLESTEAEAVDRPTQTTTVQPIYATDGSQSAYGAAAYQQYQKDNATTNDPVTLGIGEKLGVTPDGISSSFEDLNNKLNQLRRSGGITSTQHYELQRLWVSGYKKQIAQVGDVIERQRLRKELDKFLSEDKRLLKEYSWSGAAAEQLGRGVDKEWAGIYTLGSVVSSRFEKGDKEFIEQVANAEPDLAKKYEAAMGRFNEAFTTLNRRSLINFTPNEYDGLGRDPMEEAEQSLSKEDQATIKQFENLVATARHGWATSRDTSGNIIDWNRRAYNAEMDSRQPSRYAGLDERMAKVEQAESFWDTVTAIADDPGVVVPFAARQTGENLTGTGSGIVVGLITRNPVIFQAISSMGNFGAEARAALFDELQKLYEADNPNKSFLDVDYDEFRDLTKKYAPQLKAKFDNGMRNALITTAAELAASKVVGAVAAGGLKLAKSSNKLAKVLGVSTAMFAGLTGEGWEEAFGQIATNIADGEEWDKGVGKSFLMALISLEGFPNAVATLKDGKRMLTNSSPANNAPQGSNAPAATNQPTTTQTDNKPSGGGDEPDDTPTEAQALSPIDDSNAPKPIALPAVSEEDLYREYHQIQSDLAYGQGDEEALSARAKEIVAEFNKTLDDGTIYNDFDYIDWVKQQVLPKNNDLTEQVDLTTLTDAELLDRLNHLGAGLSTPEQAQAALAEQRRIIEEQQRRRQNESGNTDRDGTQNADGQIDGSGAVATDGSGTESGSEVSQPVSPTQAETITAGDSESNATPAADTTGEQNDQSQESNATGADGRTSDTNGDAGTERELGEKGSEQTGEPAEATRTGGTDSGVHERTQGDSSGETLNEKNDPPTENVASTEQGRDSTEQGRDSSEPSDKASRESRNERSSETTTSKREKTVADDSDQPREQETKSNDRDTNEGVEKVRELGRKREASKSVYEFGLGKKNKNTVTFFENEDGSVDVEIHAYTKGQGAIYQKTLKNKKLAQEWVDSTLVGSHNKFWNGKTRKLVQGDGVFGENDADAIGSRNIIPKKQPTTEKPTEKPISTTRKRKPQGPYDHILNPALRTFAEQTDKFLASNLEVSDLPEHLPSVLVGNLLSGEDYRTFHNYTLKIANYVADRLNLDRSMVEAAVYFDSIGSRAQYSVQDGKGHIRLQRAENLRRTLFALFHEAGHFFHHANIQADQYDALMNKFATNPFVKTLLDSAISRNYEQNGYNSSVRVEEILVDMYASLQIRDWSEFAKRYHVKVDDIPAALRNDSTGLIERTYKALQALVGKLLNKKSVSDRDIRSFLSALDTMRDHAAGDTKGRTEALQDRVGNDRDRLERLVVKGGQSNTSNTSNTSNQTPDNATKSKLERHVEKQNRLNRTIDGVGDTRPDESELQKRLKSEYPNVDVDKLMAVQGTMSDNYSAESHVQYQERVAKGDDPERALKEIAEVQFEVMKSRGMVKGNAAPTQWHGVIRKGSKASYGKVIKGKYEQKTTMRRLPFTAEQQARLDAAFEQDMQRMTEEAFASTDTQDQVTQILSDMQSGKYELTTPNITAEAVDKAMAGFTPAEQKQIREEAKAFSVDDEGNPLRDGEDVTNEQLASIAVHNNLDVKEKSLLRKFIDKLYSLLAAVTAIVSVGAMTVPTDAHAQQAFATYTQGETIKGVSQDVSNTANWVKANKDNNGKSFVVADKDNGKIHVFDKDGKLVNTQNALFGMNKGNDNGFGNTPSGRFALGKVETKSLGKVDQQLYGDSVLALQNPNTKANKLAKDGRIIAMHRVINKPERKAALKTATGKDNYLTQGCINVPTSFYDTSVNNLDGAMVYVLDNTDAPKQTKTAKSGFKPVDPKFKKSGSGFKPIDPKFSTGLKNFDGIKTDLTKEKADARLKKVLGKLADNVVMISRDDFESNVGLDRLMSNGVEGLYDPTTQTVYIVPENIRSQNGLSAEDRLAWVAWHELYHNGLDVKHGAKLGAILSQAENNAFIRELAAAIQLDRQTNNLATVDGAKAIEEALVELGAALSTGNLDALRSRYGVAIPADFQGGLKGILSRFVQRLRSVVGKAIGKPVLSNSQVQKLLEDAISYVEPSKADKALATEMLRDMQDPNSAITQAAMFSVGGKVKSAVSLVGDYAGNTGHTPEQDPTRAVKVNRHGVMDWRDRFWEYWQDSTQIITRLDPDGEGGRLSRAVANFQNRTAQLSRLWEKRIDGFKNDLIKFANNNKDLFPTMSDRVQADVTVQRVTTALRTITGGNNDIRRNLEEALLGKDILDAQGNKIGRVKGVMEKRKEYEEYIANAMAVGVPVSPFIKREAARYAAEAENLIQIQNKFDQDNGNILIVDQTNPDDKSREAWRGFDGYTFAEAEYALADFAAKGLIDNDIVSGLTKHPVTFQQVVGVHPDGTPMLKTVTHYEYKVDDVDNAFIGRIRPLVDQYETLSHELHQFTAQQTGKLRAGNGTSKRWEVSTMGKVREMYTHKDGRGAFTVQSRTDVDEIISMQHATQHTGHRQGRAFTGGSALEQLSWRLSLTAQQAASNEIGKEMLALHKTHPNRVKVYTTDDAEYSLQKGIVIEREKTDKNGNPVLNADGTVKTELVKVAFKDNEANAALFGDNLPRRERKTGIVSTGLNLAGFIISRWTKLNAMDLTSSLGFGTANAIKGFDEKANQLMAIGENSAWLDGVPPDVKKKYFGSLTGAKLHAELKLYKANAILNPERVIARQTAALVFAHQLMDNKVVDIAGVVAKYLGGKQLANKRMVQEEVAKLQSIYERGGISSKVEDLLGSLQARRLEFALPKTHKVAKLAFDTMEAMTIATMSQELVSTLAMTDFLQSRLGMDEKTAADLNLHFMNFNKRGTGQWASYLREYTMFANAIAQGARATSRSYFERDRDGNFHISKNGAKRAVRNVGIAMAMHAMAKMLAEVMCPEKTGQYNQVRDLNPYQLLRDIPLSRGCDSYWRYPVEYGGGMVENSFAVGMTKVLDGSWSVKQMMNFVYDAFRDNALPINSSVAHTSDPFKQLVLTFVYPFIPDPLRGGALAAMGIDQFGNKIDSRFASGKEYKPSAGKVTTDKAWHDYAEQIYRTVGWNITPEQAKVLVTGAFQGKTREILTYLIENEPKKSVGDVVLGKGSWLREVNPDTVLYTMVRHKLDDRYHDLHQYYIQAKERDKQLPDEDWLYDNGINLSADDMEVLEAITEYRQRMKNTKLTDEDRREINIEFLDRVKAVERPLVKE